MPNGPQRGEKEVGPRAFPDREKSVHARVLSDPERLRGLFETALLDSEAEEAFSRVTRLATQLTGAPTALVSLVDNQRQFFKAQSGFAPKNGPMRETPLSHSFCQYVVSENEPLGVEDARVHPLLFQNCAVADLDVVAYLGVPVRGRHGQVIGSLCVIDSEPHVWSLHDQNALLDLAALLETEIALRKNVTERQLLIDELNHRVRNLFSIVNALVRLSRRDGVSAQDFAEQLQARLGALAATHSLIQPLAAIAERSAQQMGLGALANSVMEPYADLASGRIGIDGPDVSLAATASTYLALALHELATNAVKYGALSVPDGRLSIGWTRDDAALEIAWREDAAHMTAELEAGTGFGSKLITVCVEKQLGGEIERTAGDGRLSYRFRIPARSLSTPDDDRSLTT